MKKQAELIAFLFEGQPHLLSGTLMQWMEASARFTAFIDTCRDKIRKKVRIARGPDGVLDLRAELEVAYCLLSDRRLEVRYEPYASQKRRGPDFAVTYRANLVFNIEVARIRTGWDELSGVDLPRVEERLLRILLDKLGQMQPGMANLLVILAREEVARSIDLGRLMQAVKTMADGRDPAFYAIGRRLSPSAFYKDYLNLNGILLWGPDAQLWINKQARVDLSEDVLRLVRLLASCAGNR